MHRHLPVIPTFNPLNQGIPKEKWEDYCKQEEDRKHREKEAEVARIKKAELEALEAERVALEAAQREIELKAQGMLLSTVTIRSHMCR